MQNVECVEGRFDTYGTQGRDFTNDLLGGGPTSKGFAKANLTPRTRALLEEVALSEQVLPRTCSSSSSSVGTCQLASSSAHTLCSHILPVLVKGWRTALTASFWSAWGC